VNFCLKYQALVAHQILPGRPYFQQQQNAL